MITSVGALIFAFRQIPRRSERRLEYMASEKNYLRHIEQVEAKGDEKTRKWAAAGEPTPSFYVNRKGSLDAGAGDARGRYGDASVAGATTGSNRNLNRDQFPS